jgi:hypothetical protein
MYQWYNVTLVAIEYQDNNIFRVIELPQRQTMVVKHYRSRRIEKCEEWLSENFQDGSVIVTTAEDIKEEIERRLQHLAL